MGLLDSLFDPQTYGGNGGLLSRILQSSAPIAPSAGFPDQSSFADRFNALPNAPQPVAGYGRMFDPSMFNPSTYAPNQAQPIGVGGYQMPRIGIADLYNPQQVSLPPNAQPTQGQALPNLQQPPVQQAAPQATPDQSLPPALGGGGYLNRVKAGGSLIGSLFSGSPQQENLKAQYDAMVPLVGPQKALLAVMNPEAGKTILTEALTNKNEVKDVQDEFGGHHLMWVNPLKPGVAVPLGGSSAVGNGGVASGNAPASGVNQMIDNIHQLREQGAPREQLLQQVPPAYRDLVDGLLKGQALPANVGRSQLRGPVIALAHAVDGNFDETQLPLRAKMRSDFSGEGKNGQAIGAFNTAQHHIDKLSDDLESLAKFHGNYPTINSIKDWFSANLNSNPQLRDTVQSVKTDMAAVSHEVANAYNAGHLSDHDMATWNALTNSDLPPDQLRRGISDFVDLLNGKRDSLNHMYRQQFGQDAPSIESDKNEAITKKVHQRSPQYGNGAQSSGLPSGWSVQVR